METVTLACPAGLTDPNVDPETAPIWTDGANEYWVASGLLDGDYVTSDPMTASPTRVSVVVGYDGLTALTLMGLVRKAVADE